MLRCNVVNDGPEVSGDILQKFEKLSLEIVLAVYKTNNNVVSLEYYFFIEVVLD